MAMPEIKVRSISKANMEADLEAIMDVFNDAWSDNWGFVPATESEVKKAPKI